MTARHVRWLFGSDQQLGQRAASVNVPQSAFKSEVVALVADGVEQRAEQGVGRPAARPAVGGYSTKWPVRRRLPRLPMRR